MVNFKPYRSSDGQYYWRLDDSNGELLADGTEGYGSVSGVEDAIRNVKQDIEDGSAEFESYQNSDGQYYWRLNDPDGETVADGAEGYASNDDVQDAIGRIGNEIPDASVESTGA